MFLGSPLLLKSLRVVASAGVGFLKNSRPSSLVSVGGDSGLRGYVIGEFRGKAQAQTHLEIRSRALTVFSLRAGGLVFWDMGHAAPTLSALTPFHDTGLGLRVLIPQLNPYVIRLDWSLALQATPFTRAGLPGRFSLGFRQVF
jgi:hypothetical protein